MIVKNEEQHLGRLLSSIAQFADEIVVLDTGSTDRTMEIAKSHGAEVPQFKWCDDFAKARNESLSHCTCDFIMWLDADDIIATESVEKLDSLFGQAIDWDLLYLPYYYNYSPGRKRRGQRKFPPRIWRNNLGIEWVLPIHEHIVYPPNVRKHKITSGIEVLHNSLRPGTVRADRNMRILKKTVSQPEYRWNDYIHWHIAKEHRNKGNPRQAIRSFQKAISTCPPDSRVRMARMYLGLAQQYTLIGDFHHALIASGHAAQAYTGWREPYCLMAECYARLGEHEISNALIDLASGIPLPNNVAERVELYGAEGLRKIRAGLSALGPASTKVREPKHGSFKLFVGGSVNLGGNFQECIGLHDAEHPLDAVKDLIHRCDAGMVQLECALGNRKDVSKRKESVLSRIAAPQMLDCLSESGINVVTLASEYCLSLGRNSVEAQIELLDATGIGSCGAGRDYLESAAPVYLRNESMSLAVLAMDTRYQNAKASSSVAGLYHCAENDLPMAAAAALAEAKAHADMVVVSVNWDLCPDGQLSAERRQVARQIIDLGADAVLGHIGHTFQGIELHRGRPIIYGLGKFLSPGDDDHDVKRPESIALEMHIQHAQIKRLQFHPILAEPGMTMLATKEDAERICDLITGMCEQLDSNLQFVREPGRIMLELDLQQKVLRSFLPPPSTRTYDRSTARAVPGHYRTT